MDKAQADRLWRRAMRALSDGMPEMAPHDATVPVADYLDASRFERELRLLRRHPLPVAAAVELVRPGDYTALTRLGIPMLIVRGQDGVLRAFVNVCRHRGAQVVAPGRGTQGTRFSCPYHAWTYASNGELQGVPKSFGFPCLDKAGSGLRPLAVAEAAGLVWVVPDAALAACDVRQMLGPLADEFGLHRRLFLAKASLASEAASGPEAFDPRLHGNIIYFFFPSTALLVQPDHAQLSVWEPLAADRTLVHEITLVPEAPANERAERHWDRNIALYRTTLAEDYALAESTQAGLASGANESLRFGRFEFAAPRFHAQLGEALDALP